MKIYEYLGLKNKEPFFFKQEGYNPDVAYRFSGSIREIYLCNEWKEAVRSEKTLIEMLEHPDKIVKVSPLKFVLTEEEYIVVKYMAQHTKGSDGVILRDEDGIITIRLKLMHKDGYQFTATEYYPSDWFLGIKQGQEYSLKEFEEDV